MQEEYDRKKTAALIKEAHEITHHLKAETESLKRQMARVLEGDEDEPIGAPETRLDASISNEQGVGKSFWQFWR
jgi:hypothetical protein